MVPKIGNLGRKGGVGHFLIELRSKAIPILIDRLPAVQADVEREAKRPCKKKRRGGDGPKETTLFEPKNSTRERTNERANAAFRLQFHAIESARIKLKTNRFSAPCWHALHLRGSSHVDEWKKRRKKTGHKPNNRHMKTHVWSIYTNESTKSNDHRLILRGWFSTTWRANCFPSCLNRVCAFRLIEIR